MAPKFSKIMSRQNSIGKNILTCIKKYLMSRDITLQIEAVEVLIEYLEIDTTLSEMSTTVIQDTLLDADIAEFLGEAMATQHCILLNKIFTCLELLSNSERFFAQNHTVCHVLECLLRSIHFLLQKCEDTSTLNLALKLLAIIFDGFGSNLPVSSVCNILHVLEMLDDILKQGCSNSENTLAAGLVLYTLLLHSQFDLDLFRQLPDIIRQCFIILSQLVTVQDVANDAVALMARIGHAATITCDNMDVDLDDCASSGPRQTLSVCKKKVLQSVVEYIQSVCAPYIMDEDTDNCDSSGIYYNVLICLYALYQESSIDHQQLSHKLASLGYIIFLPVISLWAVNRNERSLKKASMSVLGEFLGSLSHSALGVAAYWPGGFCAFKAHLQYAALNLPAETELWPHMLVMKGAPQFYKDFIIIYFYYFFLFLPSPLDYDLDLSTLAAYLLQLSSSSPCPTPIVKALWFIFSITVLSGQASVPKRLVDDATGVLVEIIERTGDPGKVYTHHPAILFWVFCSSRINSKLQIIVMNLWLEREDDSSNVQLIHLVLANPDASFCLLDVIQQGDSKIVKRATSILSKAIAYEGRKGAEDLIFMLWDTLPLVLAQYGSRSNSLQAMNVANFIRVACTSIPSAPSTATIFRTASLLTSLLTRKSDVHPEFNAAALQLALYVLIVSVRLKDKRVLTSYITHEHFLEVLRQGVEKTDAGITIPSLKLLTHILQVQENFGISYQSQLMRHCSVGIEALNLLALLASKNVSILFLCLQLLYLLLEDKVPTRIVRITMKGSEVVSSQFVQTFFLRLQNLCSMNLPGITNSCWKCMGAVLYYATNCHADPSLLPLLATQPWTHLMIRFTVSTNDAELSSEFLYFLCLWLQYYDTNNNGVQLYNLRQSRRKSRAPYQNLLSISVNRLGPALLVAANNISGTSSKHSQLVMLVLCRILVTSADLQSEIEVAMKQRLLRLYYSS